MAVKNPRRSGSFEAVAVLMSSQSTAGRGTYDVANAAPLIRVTGKLTLIAFDGVNGKVGGDVRWKNRRVFRMNCGDVRWLPSHQFQWLLYCPLKSDVKRRSAPA
jgi:hypothetical protein